MDGRETLSEGMDLYGSGVESLTNYHHLLHNLQQSVKNNVSLIQGLIDSQISQNYNGKGGMTYNCIIRRTREGEFPAAGPQNESLTVNIMSVS